MKKVLIILFTSFFSATLLAQTDQGNFYVSVGNAYTPVGSERALTNSLFSNSTGLSLGNEWITNITVDGDDDDDNGTVYWDDDQKESISNFNISGQFGYFVIDGFLAGLGLEYGRISFNDETETDVDGDGRDDTYIYKSSFSSLAFSPFVRYYVPIGDNAIFFNTAYTFGSVNSKYSEEYDYSSQNDENDSEEAEPYRTSRLEFGTGLTFFLNESIAFEPCINYALNKYTQEREFGSLDQNGNYIYEDKDEAISTNAFYFKLAASLYF